MNKPDPIDLTLQANAWCDNVRQWFEDIDQLEADHAAFRRRIEAAILSTREAGEPNKQPAANNGN